MKNTTVQRLVIVAAAFALAFILAGCGPTPTGPTNPENPGGGDGTSSNYSSFGAEADGYWLVSGYTALYVENSTQIANGASYELRLGVDGKVYVSTSGTYAEYTAFGWTGSGFTYNGSPMTRVTASELSDLPASADGEWWSGNYVQIAISGSTMVNSPNHPLRQVASGKVYYYNPISITDSTYTWDGTSLSYNSTPLSLLNEADYPLLPANADGAWYAGAASPQVEITNSTATISTLFSTLRTDVNKVIWQFYTNASGMSQKTKSPYSWDGKRVWVTGGTAPMTCADGHDLSCYHYVKPVSGQTTYTDEGEFSLALYQTIAGYPTTVIYIYDTETLNVYNFKQNFLARASALKWYPATSKIQ